ncbi:DUF2270 domain-containing protein [Halobacterium rubrum]|uniref:DUF2270 domain-containing protein n=1 Tax=Halobacterium TaxID=2239 RepID=UPI001F31160E|nr:MULTISPECIES: DUF2270 domain-containing protein [Halobacterium]MDH5019377.1 DUF2270 domain-containing protein [Halobacterium rubrum]
MNGPDDEAGDHDHEEFDSAGADERQVGREMADDSSGLGSVLAHAYRGEIDRVGTWRQRLDQTTTWAVTVLAAILTWAFSTSDNPHYVLLVGVVVLTIFLWVEARRYRHYDVFRSRVRLLQENLFATAVDPSEGVEERDWRADLSRDFRRPTLKVPFLEALANRLRRMYLALLGVLLVAWVFRLAAFSPPGGWLAAAAIERIPGEVVVTAVGAYYAVLLVVAFWPRERHAKGEFREGDPEEWEREE